MTNGTTARTFGINEPLSLDKVIDAMRGINMPPKNDQWIVITPEGQMYKGRVDQVLPVLMAEHPLVKLSTTIMRIDG